jgi:hypothetical protein
MPRSNTGAVSATIQAMADAELAGLAAPVFGQFVRQDRDEDEIVDAEHDFHHDQRGKRGPDGGIGQQREDRHGRTCAVRATPAQVSVTGRAAIWTNSFAAWAFLS